MRERGKYKPGDTWPNGLKVLAVEEETVTALCVSEKIAIRPIDMWQKYSSRTSVFTFDTEPGDGGSNHGTMIREEAPRGTYKVGQEYVITKEITKTEVPVHESTSSQVVAIDAVNLLGL